MRKLILTISIAMAAMLLTQCRKSEVPQTGEQPVPTFEVTLNATNSGGDKSEFDGYKVKWNAGDKLYVVDVDVTPAVLLGYLSAETDGTLVDGQYQASFKGGIIQPAGNHNCRFYYVGNTTFSLDGSGNYSYSVATQDGDLANLANKLQLLKSSSTAAIDLANHNFGSNPINMVSMMAIGHFNFTVNSSTYTGEVTVTGGLATATLDAKNGTLGAGTANTITLGAGTTGERYMALIPGSQTLSFAADGATATIATQEVQANKLYDQLNVNMEALESVFSVGPGISDKVVFSPGNLWYGRKAGATDPTWNFEENQWETTPSAVGQSGSTIEWSDGHVSHFYWSNTTDWQASGKEPYAEDYSYSTLTTSDVFFTNNPGDAGSPNPDFTVEGEKGTWRTLSKAEWSYLIGQSTPGRSTSLRQWSTVTFDAGGTTVVSGLILMPDNWSGTLAATTAYSTWQTLASAGAVFLPAAGYRYGTSVYDVGSHGDCWSCSPLENLEGYAYYMYFSSGYVCTLNYNRSNGYAVRLVRSGS